MIDHFFNEFKLVFFINTLEKSSEKMSELHGLYDDSENHWISFR